MVGHRRGGRFGERARDYELGRPGYPEAVLSHLPRDASTIVNLGAGTGKLTRLLSRTPATVLAFDPDLRMLAKAPKTALRVGAEAVALPLRDRSVDVLAVGQAAHWFDTPAVRDELERVLRPGGTLVVVEMLFDDRDPWVEQLMRVYEPSERVSARSTDEPPARNLGPLLHAGRYAYHHPVDTEGVLARVRSSSRWIGSPPEMREDMLARASAALPREDTGVEYECWDWTRQY